MRLRGHMDNIDFLGVVAGHIEAGTIFRSGLLSNAEIAAKVRAAVAELKQLRSEKRVHEAQKPSAWMAVPHDLRSRGPQAFMTTCEELATQWAYHGVDGHNVTVKPLFGAAGARPQ